MNWTENEEAFLRSIWGDAVYEKVRDRTTKTDAVSVNAVASPAGKNPVEPASDKAKSPPADAEIVMLRSDDLIGQAAAKAAINQVIAMARVNNERKLRELKPHKVTLHAVFSGNPGTGKTTFARYYAQEIRQLGLLSKGHLVEVTRHDLVSEHMGGTAPKTAKIVESAKGGVLFIDEAYSIINGDSDQYGKECIDTLLKLIEDLRDDLIVILAGYSDEMREFLRSNPGLQSRIPNFIEFEDFTDAELAVMFDRMLGKADLQVTPIGRRLAMNEITRQRKSRYFGNGREVRNLFERAIGRQSERLSRMELGSLSLVELNTLEDADISDHPLASAGGAPGPTTALEKLQALRGLVNIKREITELANYMAVAKARNADGVIPNVSLHMIFTGNPGTGKTTVARLVGDIFRDLGILPSGHLVEADRSQLVAGYEGQTAIKTREMVEHALGGVLFIDEAYALSARRDAYGQEAIATLLKSMEDYRQQFALILAGYTGPMDDFLDANPGLRSRIPLLLEFPDFSLDDLMEIAGDMANAHGYQLEDAALTILRTRLLGLQARGDNFGNAREVRNILEEAYKQQASRLVRLGKPADFDKSVLNTLTADDLAED
ncbi:MAG: AAA family ATPase [Gammaproteobacteria bacterium]|nr:AAA family ATPase [Gammaproteobacteria bacterium]MBU2478968.1 AAA family ATPase [Gammaproteobacteria bacterium]